MSRNFSQPQAYSEKEYLHIEMQPVESGQIRAIGYDANKQILAVTFARGGGAIYHYPGVSRETYDAFMAAESKGTFFGQHIKDLPFDKFPAELAKSADPAEAEPATQPETTQEAA